MSLGGAWLGQFLAVQAKVKALVATGILTITPAGLALVDDADAAEQRTTLGIITGSWTPTITTVANIAASTSALGYYVQIGDIVICIVAPTIDPTLATTSTSFRLSLPVASDFTGTTQAAGSGSNTAVAGPVLISSNAATNDISVVYITGADVANRQFNLIFGYVVL